MNTRKIAYAVVAAVVVVLAYVLLSGGDEGHEIKAELPNAGGVKIHSSVKIAGVPGGSVDKIDITKRDTALVTMKIDDDAWPIGKDASVEIRPTDLLGERYVALDAGNVKNAAADGYTIPKSRSKLPVELDNVLNTFDGDTRTRIQVLINQFGVALGNRGKDLAKLLDTMPATLGDARALVTQITNESASLKALLQRGDQFTAAINPKSDKLASLITQADTTLQALSDRREKIGRTLDSAPGGLAALNRTLGQLRVASTDLRPASNDIANAAGPLKDTLDALPGLEESGRQSLKAAKSAAPSLTRLGKKGTPPLRALTPTLANVRQFSTDFRPTLNAFDDRAFEDALWFVQNIALGLKGRDALGHQIGAAAAVNPETFQSVLQSLFNNNQGKPTDENGVPTGTEKSKRSSTKGSGGSGGSSSSGSGTTTTSPSTSQSPPASTGSSPSAKPDKGLLGGLVDGVSGLLGGNSAPNSKPGASQGGVSGLLNNLLAP